MQKFNVAQAQQALLLHANNNTLTVAQLQQLLQNTSVTFAQLLYVTQVLVAAQHKHNNVQKVTSANVILCSNIAAHSSVYARKVRKHAALFAQNSAHAVQQFTAQQNYFVHTATHSIVQHAQHANKFYLYAIYNNAQSIYFVNNTVANKQQVAQLLTASAAKQLLQTDNIVHNKTHNIVHNVQVRTIALSNIVQVHARKQLLTV